MECQVALIVHSCKDVKVDVKKCIPILPAYDKHMAAMHVSHIFTPWQKQLDQSILQWPSCQHHARSPLQTLAPCEVTGWGLGELQ